MMSDLLTKEVRLDEAMMASWTAGVLQSATVIKKIDIYHEYGLILKITEVE